jgi:hypothetical protein
VRKEVVAKESVEFKANYEAKLLIIQDAEKLDPIANLTEAKKQLLLIQNRYEKAGKVPKDKIRETDDRMRAVEKKIKDAEQEHWRKSDPAAIERTSGVLSQLEQSISKLEQELEAALAAGDSSKIETAKEALDARRSWLTVVKQNQN